MGNTFGHIFRLTSFGESHGKAIGGVIDGFPSGYEIDFKDLQQRIDRRRPGRTALDSRRREPDEVEFLSGVFEGVSIGSPIGFIIRNADVKSADYDNLREVYRPSHADYTYQAKYGVRDHRGGGRASARVTAACMVAGALAMQFLEHHGITIRAYTSSIGEIAMPEPSGIPSLEAVDQSAVRCPDAEVSERMVRLVESVRSQGDTVGGVVSCIVSGVPVGLGDPVADKLSAMLASAMMSINAAKGFEIGMGFEGARRRGSEMNDRFIADGDGHIGVATNHSGGIQGGISNGAPITFRVAFKPVATLMQEISTVDIHGKSIRITPKGRHDACVVARAVPIVEAMAAMVMLDAWLMNGCSLKR
ncbi:MAG: chorismate synthase [Muribaculaceae bacterium]|nr:chorismate synthase [Muribaculaceae bacterium]